MRPINKGDWPLKGNSNTKRKVFVDWTRAIKDLVNRTGTYCHFCEMRVTNALAIEHLLPQEHYPERSGDWDNFLLTCSYCNSHKSATIPINPYTVHYVWPHLNNTLLAVDYTLVGEVVPKRNLGPDSFEYERAQNIIALYGLDKTTTSSGDSDTRWTERADAIVMAVTRRAEFNRGINNSVDAIIDLARKTGFFSIWLKIFNDVAAVRDAIIQCPDFHVPVAECFDAQLNLITRSANDI